MDSNDASLVCIVSANHRIADPHVVALGDNNTPIAYADEYGKSFFCYQFKGYDNELDTFLKQEKATVVLREHETLTFPKTMPLPAPHFDQADYF